MDSVNIYQKLLAIQKARVRVTKDANNPFYKSKYVTLDHLVEILLPHCDENGLVIVHGMKDNELVTMVVNADNKDEYVVSRFPIQKDLEPQKVGSAITYAKRYNLGQLFNVITDEDDDANATTGKAVESAKPQSDGFM